MDVCSLSEFIIFCSMSLFCSRKEKMESLLHRVNIFKQKVSSVIGLKLQGSLKLSLLQTFFHSHGMLPDLQIELRSFVITMRRQRASYLCTTLYHNNFCSNFISSIHC